MSLGAAAVLAVAGLAPAATALPGGPAVPPDPDLPPAASTAQATLASVTEAFDGSSAPQQAPVRHADGRDLTLLLRDLRVQLPSLHGADRRRAEAYLARPTDGGSDPYGDGYSVPGEDDCGAGEPGRGTDFCIHWVKTTSDAPPLADTDPKNGIPDQVDRTRATVQHVWKEEVGVAGYKAPLLDAGPPHAGPNTKFDVYLADIGGQGLYGYCASEPTPDSGKDASAYCVLDDDYATVQYPANTPLENLQVTAAHEFFHAIQFAYDALEDTWFMEGTATWMEDEVYDDVNDNRFYLDYSALTAPGRSLDNGSGLYVYGTWLWWRYLSEHFTADEGTGIPTIIRRVWREADDSDPKHPGTYSLGAVRRALEARHATLTATFAGFGVANRQPKASYEEGAAYSVAPAAASYKLSASSPKQSEQTSRIDHLATQTIAYRPGSGLATGGWRLQVKVDAPAAKHNPAVSVTSFRKDGTTRTRLLTLDKDGIGGVTVGFDSDVVRRVDLTLSNAGHRFDCNADTLLSCRGRSLSNDRPFAYTVRLTH